MKEKIETIDGQRYRFRKLPADVGSFIHWRMMGALLDTAARAAEKKTEEAVEATAEPKQSEEDKARMLCTLAFMRGLSFEDSQFAQRSALQAIARMEMLNDVDTPMPVMTDSGKIAIPEVAENPALASKLTIESLVFSLASFFLKSGEQPK